MSPSGGSSFRGALACPPAMATLDRQDPEYLYVALVDATGPRRMEGVDFHTGTFRTG